MIALEALRLEHIAVSYTHLEFEAQANMLFDSEITEFMHEENVVCVAADAVYYLTLAAGMTPEKIYAQ